MKTSEGKTAVNELPDSDDFDLKEIEAELHSESESVREIIRKCKLETRISYPPGGGVFKPRMKGINHLEIGRSKIISSPFTIMLEWLLLQWTRLKRCFRALLSWIFPRRPAIWGHRKDSRLVGRVIHSGDRGNGSPIHHLHLEFWGRTRLGGWRKLSQGRTDKDGYFALPFDLREARRLWVKSLTFEIHTTTRVYFKEDDPHFHYDLFHSQAVTKSDLIGLDYNLRTIRLDYWLYREDAPTPRASVSDVTADDSEKYSEGRVNALMEQILPFELTKIKHLDQIKLEPGTLTIPEIQADYPLNLTTCIEKHLPGYTRGDDWFGERMMNGMNRGLFEEDAKQKGR